MTRPGYESGATPASEFPPPAAGTRPASPSRPGTAEPAHPVWGYPFGDQRTLDPVRACALEQAIRSVAAYWTPGAMAPEKHLEEVFRTAAKFESWLSGGEPPDPAGR